MVIDATRIKIVNLIDLKVFFVVFHVVQFVHLRISERKIYIRLFQ